MKPKTMVKVLRQCAALENFRWIVERSYLTEAADMIEGLLDEAEMCHKSCEEHIRARNELADLVRSLVDREPCRIDHNGMLGWLNEPPLDCVERDISSLKTLIKELRSENARLRDRLSERMPG